MEILANKKKVNRIRLSIDSPYCYYLGKQPGQIEHKIGTNYARLFLSKNLKAWEKIHSWEYEPQYYKTVRPDGFMTVKNSVTGKLNCYFIEFDRASNPFDKIAKYNDLYNSNGFSEAWWANSVDRFPAIVVVSENIERAQRHLKENKCNLEFRFIDYNQIREGFIC